MAAEEQKPTAKILTFPGVVYQPENMTKDGEILLEAVRRQGVRDLVVLGLDVDGDLYLASETADPDALIGKLSRALNWLTKMEDITDD